ncbi:hypothetical protein KIPB_015764, partial [Kipferlia bialata]|eukprot:g15764.t1
MDMCVGSKALQQTVVSASQDGTCRVWVVDPSAFAGTDVEGAEDPTAFAGTDVEGAEDVAPLRCTAVCSMGGHSPVAVALMRITFSGKGVSYGGLIIAGCADGYVVTVPVPIQCLSQKETASEV